MAKNERPRWLNCSPCRQNEATDAGDLEADAGDLEAGAAGPEVGAVQEAAAGRPAGRDRKSHQQT